MIDMLSFFADEMVSATWTPGAAGIYVNGEWVEATASPSTISMVFPQPLGQEALNKILQQLPQGERTKNFKQSWTKADVDVRAGTTDSDTITYDGKTYLVHDLGDREFSGGFRKMVLREKTADE